MKRRTFIAIASLLGLAPFAPAQALETNFTKDALAAAQQDGKRVLVHVWASWCPECKAQTPIIEGLLKKPENGNVVFLRLNFDTQVADWKALGARSQSTLIMYKGIKETARLVGDTRPEAIAALVASAK